MLREIRKERGYTQRMLAALSGVSLRTIRRIEQGHEQPRTQSTARKLAGALNVDWMELYKEDGNHAGD